MPAEYRWAACRGNDTAKQNARGNVSYGLHRGLSDKGLEVLRSSSSNSQDRRDLDYERASLCAFSARHDGRARWPFLARRDGTAKKTRRWAGRRKLGILNSELFFEVESTLERSTLVHDFF